MPATPRPQNPPLTPLEQLEEILDEQGWPKTNRGIFSGNVTAKPRRYLRARIRGWLQRWRDRRNQLSATRHIVVAFYRDRSIEPARKEKP